MLCCPPFAGAASTSGQAGAGAGAAYGKVAGGQAGDVGRGGEGGMHVVGVKLQVSTPWPDQGLRCVGVAAQGGRHLFACLVLVYILHTTKMVLF
jgi:hypothetical protein